MTGGSPALDTVRATLDAWRCHGWQADDVVRQVRELWGKPPPRSESTLPPEPPTGAPQCLRCGWPMAEAPADGTVPVTARLAAAERSVERLLGEVVAENEQLQNLADRTLTLLTLLESGPWKNSPDDADWRKLLADLRGG